MTAISNIDSLQSALSGLATAKARIDTVSRNISNAGNDSYSRKVQDSTTTDLGGVVAGPIRRSVDESINRALREVGGETNRLDVTVKMLGNVEAVLGTPSASSSLGSVMGRLQNAYHNLSVSPHKDAAYGSTVSAAQDLARTFNSVYGAMEEQRSEANTELKVAVADVNETLQQIDQTNKAILVGRSGDTTDLEDRRDALLQKLTGLMEVTTFTKTDGQVAVYTRSGAPLVDASVRTLDPSELGAVQPSAGPPLIIVRTGKIGGLLGIRDVAMPAAQAQLDEIARATAEEFKATGVELFKDGGSTTVDTTLDPTQTVGLAGRIAVNDAYVQNPALIRDGNSAIPLGPADTTFIDAAAALFTKSNVAFNSVAGIPPSGSLLQVATDFVAQRGNDRVAASDALDHQKNLQQVFQDKRSQVSGVSVDDELSQLVQLQQSYSAAARIIETTKSLLDQLVQAVQ
jgi:flagellar hook-associated protein 1